MNKVLVINLKRFGDIYMGAHLTHSIIKEHPQAKISLLTFVESLKATTNLIGINRVFSIDRKKITAITDQPLYPSEMALSIFQETINEIEMMEFDTIINYSNDLLSTLICSYFKSKKPETNIIGIHQDKEGRVIPSGFWATVMNDVLPGFQNSPIHFTECYHRMTGVPFSTDEIKVAIKDSYRTKATTHFREIRDAIASLDEGVQLIGIQLLTSDIKKDLPENTIVELIEKLLDDARFYPIILIAPFDNEREYADRINRVFDKTLIIVEADFEALTSTLLNLDVVVTPDTVTKHLANLTATPVVEVSLGSAPATRQGSIGEDDIILTPNLGCYPCSAKRECRITPKHICQKLITANDLFNSIATRLGHAVGNTVGQAFNTLTTKINETNGFIHYAGATLHSQFIRSYLYVLDGMSIQLPDIPINVIDIEKSSLTTLMTHTQSALKDISLIKANGLPSPRFNKELDQILHFCREETATSVAAKLFRAKVENLRGTDIKQNATDIEVLLYELRDSLHLLGHLLLRGTKINTTRPGGIYS